MRVADIPGVCDYKIRCQICDEFHSYNKVKELHCGHNYCDTCFYQYILYVPDGSQTAVARCPKSTCGMVDPMEINRCIVKSENNKYQAALVLKTGRYDPNTRSCPYDDCDSLYTPNADNICSYCQRKICPGCDAPKHRGPCWIKRTFTQSGRFKYKYNKNCPNCDAFIHKVSGVDETICDNCHITFCWKCSHILEKDKFNIHCKKKYGFIILTTPIWIGPYAIYKYKRRD